MSIASLGLEDPLVRTGNAVAAVGLSYRPHFTFLKGL